LTGNKLQRLLNEIERNDKMATMRESLPQCEENHCRRQLEALQAFAKVLIKMIGLILVDYFVH